MAWNISKEKRRALVKLQLRDKNGRFVEMGSGVKWFSSNFGKEVSGEVVDGSGSNAIVRLNKESGGKLVSVPAKNITVIDSKASLPAKDDEKSILDDPEVKAPEPVAKVEPEVEPEATPDVNAPEDAVQPLTVSKTSDGNTYITAPEGAQLYTPAKELAVGDEVIAPDGADPMKPFSMGKAWATKNAERVNTQGVKIGKVISIKEHAYAVVQLPEGEMIPHVKTGEPQNSVTIGLSNKVIKATPELKEQLKDVIPEPVYTAPEATDADAEKKAKRLSMLKISPAGTLVKSKSGDDVVFNKFADNDWGKNDGSAGYTDEDVVSHISNNEEIGWLVEQDTNTGLSNEKPSDTSVTDEELHTLVGESFKASLNAESTIPSEYFEKDETFGNFAGFNSTEAYSIEQYVGGSNYINGSLRAGKVEDAQLARQILGIDNIMAKSVMAEDATVYRGLTANQAIVDGLLNKGVLHDHAFTSTSQDANKASEWVENSGGMGTFPVVMEIALPKGFTAHKIDYSLVGEAFSPEAEVLLPRNLDFDITGVEEYTTPAGHKGYRVKATPILTEKNFKTGENNGTEGNTGDSNNGDAGSSTDSSAGNEAGTGTDSGQSGEIRDNSGTGNVPESGGSSGEENPESEDQDSDGPLDPEYEALAKEIAALKAEITGTPVPRTRDEIMDDLAPVDTTNWKKVGSQAGSNPGGVFEDENGQKWYVKQSKSDAHARAEVLASQLYNATGVGSPSQKLTTFNGKLGTASPMIDGAKSDLGSKYGDKAYMDKIREGFAVDAWLANWDVVGLGDDNIVTDKDGNPNRIDTGGTMMFRAQGGKKNDQQPGAWGPEVKDWDGLRSKGEAQKAFKGISDQQMVDSAARVESVSPEEIDAMVDALGWSGPEADELKTTLKARREDIIKKAAALGVEPSAKDEKASEAAPADEPFEPVMPSAQKAPEAPKLVEPADEPFEPVKPSAQPKFPKATKENPNVLQGYTIEKNEQGAYYPKERLSASAWQGLRNGTVVPPAFPFIPYNTNDGDVHYWDSEGNRHWGQFGGAGALTRRKNADGEYEYLLAQRASTLSTAPNMWTTPGGAHKTDADSMSDGLTAKNELLEELGIEVPDTAVATFKHSNVPDWSYDYSIFDAPDAEVDMKNVDTREIQDVQWLTSAQIKALKEDGKLHPAMSEVLDDLLKASESAEGPETSKEDSNAPEAPSTAAETPSLVEPDEAVDPILDYVKNNIKIPKGMSDEETQQAIEQQTEMLKKIGFQPPQASKEESSPETSVTEESDIKTDGPSVTMADGNPAYEGSKITHAKFGTGTVIKIIAGKSAKIEFDDGLVKIAQAHKISSFEGESVPDAPVDTTGMAPGDYANNPANGKLFIVGADGTPMYQGDKVSATHKGETMSGVIKGIYKSTNSVAIIFDGDEKPTTKKAALTTSQEPKADAPEAPVSVPASEDGYTEEERVVVEALESKVSKIYQGAEDGDVEELEKALDYLYAKAEARLGSAPEPEEIPEIEERLKSDDPVKALTETAPEAPEETPEAPESLVEPEVSPEPVVETWDDFDFDIVPEAPETPREPVTAGDTAENLPTGTVLSIGESGGTTFTKGEDGIWEMAVDGKPTLVLANKGMVQDMLDNHTVSVKKPGDLTKEERLQKTLDELDEIDAFLKDKQSQEALAALRAKLKATPWPSDEAPKTEVWENPENLADWEKELLEDPEGAPEGTPEETPENNNGMDDSGLEEWEKELLGINTKSQKQETFDAVEGFYVPDGATAAELDEMPTGAKIVHSAAPHLVYEKQDYTHDIMQGMIWKANDLEDFEAYPEELANGQAIKVVDWGKTKKDDEAEAAKEIKDIVDKAAAFDNAPGEHLIAPSGAELDQFPVGTKVLSFNGFEYTKHTEGTGYGDSLWNDSEGNNFTSQEISDGSDYKAVTPDSVDTEDVSPENDPTISPLGFKKNRYKPENVPPELTDKVSKMPIGTVIGHPEKTQWYKKDIDVWDSMYKGEKEGTESNYSDESIADLINYFPQEFSDEYVFYPEGLLPVEDTTPKGILEGKTLEDIKNLPDGSKIFYSTEKNFSEPTGTYEKTSSGTWSYIPTDEAYPPAHGLSDSIFDSLFSDVDLMKYFSLSEAAKPVDDAPVVDNGVEKNVKVAYNAEYLDSLPIGTTLKNEKHATYYDKNELYYVKNPDGTWAGFKKTSSKIMSQGDKSSKTISSIFNTVTVSKPLGDNHVILGTGEIAYAGDEVIHDGIKYTIKKVMVTGISAVDDMGNKVKLKPHGVKKDLKYGLPADVSHVSNSKDPLSLRAEKYEKEKKAKIEAQLKLEKVQEDLKKFAGASSDDYDAYGVEAPSNPSPMIDSGLKTLDIGEPDTSDPLYGTPKPVKPATENNYPAFQAPEMPELPKWDSQEWLKKVQKRYADNPNKAKSTVEESNNWQHVVAAMEGNKSSVEKLYSSKYLDDAMYKEAIEKIEAQIEANKPLISEHDKNVENAKKLYDAKKEEDLKDITKALNDYDSLLENWIKANPAADAYKKPKLPKVSTEAFKAGPADWSKAHVGTYTAKDVFDSIKADNVLGTKGLSIATDSDQIEDLDVKVTKVLDSTGAEKLEMKFKLTAPYGEALAATLDADSKVNKSGGIYTTHMVLDKNTGLLKESGKPGENFVHSGTRYTYTDTATGAKVVFQKSMHTGLNVSTNDNSVKIHMPVDSTPEMYQQALENLGIKKARPSTAGDITVLAENKLISMMGNHQGSVKTYDGRVNMSGEQRKKALEEIKQQFGVTPDDLTFSTEPNGRVRFTLSDEKAKAFAEKYKVGYFQHNVASNSVDTWVGMIAGKNPGLLSTYHRFTEGIGGMGSSSSSDMNNGSGDYVYLTPKSKGHTPSGHGQVIIKPDSIFKRMDYWANPGDGWGKKASGGSTSHKSPFQLFEQQGSVGFSGYGGGVYEILPKDTVPISEWAYAIVPSGIRNEIIEKLQAQGILEINGLPLEEFIRVTGEGAPEGLTT